MKKITYDTQNRSICEDIKIDVPNHIKSFDEGKKLIHISKEEYNILSSKKDNPYKRYILEKYRDLLQYDYTLYLHSKECQKMVDILDYDKREYQITRKCVESTISHLIPHCTTRQFNAGIERLIHEGSPVFVDIIASEFYLEQVTPTTVEPESKELSSYCKNVIQRKWLEALLLQLKGNRDELGVEDYMWCKYMSSKSNSSWSDFKKKKIDFSFQTFSEPFIEPNNLKFAQSYKLLIGNLRSYAIKHRQQRKNIQNKILADFILGIIPRNYSSSNIYRSFEDNKLVENVLRASFLLKGKNRSALYGIIYCLNYHIEHYKGNKHNNSINMMLDNSITLHTGFSELKLTQSEYVTLRTNAKINAAKKEIREGFQNDYDNYINQVQERLKSTVYSEICSICYKEELEELTRTDWVRYYSELKKRILENVTRTPFGKEYEPPYCYYILLNSFDTIKKELLFTGDFLIELLVNVEKNNGAYREKYLYEPMYMLNLAKEQTQSFTPNRRIKTSTVRIKGFLEYFYSFCDWTDTDQTKNQVKTIFDAILESDNIVRLLSTDWPKDGKTDFNIRLLYNIMGYIKEQLSLNLRVYSLAKYLKRKLTQDYHIAVPSENWREHFTKYSSDFDKCRKDIIIIIEEYKKTFY